jgi:putative addiction module component (TIGR02574 family)
MTESKFDDVVDAAMDLADDERQLLAELLLDSVAPEDPEVKKENLAEVHRRLERLKRGETTTLSAQEVFAKHGLKTDL